MTFGIICPVCENNPGGCPVCRIKTVATRMPVATIADIERHINERLNQHSDNIAGWESGLLAPTEPDEEERLAVICELRAAVFELTVIRRLINGEGAW